jgi:hypothetical protein
MTTEPTALLEAMVVHTTLPDGGRREARRITEAKRQVVLTLKRSVVTLAMLDDGPLIGRGMASRQLLGFTDPEALDAWVWQRPVDAAPLAPPLDVAGGPTALGALFGPEAVTGILLNAAGPAACLVHVEGEYRAASEPSVKRTTGAPGHPWLDPAGRVGPRRDIAGLLAEAEDAASRGGRPALDPYVPRFARCTDFGDLATHAALTDLLATAATPEERAVQGVVHALTSAAMQWGRIGDTRRCATRLVAAALSLADGLDRGAEPDTADMRDVLGGLVDYLNAMEPLDIGEDGATAVRDAALRWPRTER